MASIVGCPSCSSNLELPRDVDIAARAACPVCQAEFPVCQAPLQALPKAVLLAEKEELPTSGEGVHDDAAGDAGVGDVSVGDVSVGEGGAKPQAATFDESDDATVDAIESSDRLGELLSSYMKSESEEASSEPAPRDDSAPSSNETPLSRFASGSSLLRDFEDSLAESSDSVAPDVSSAETSNASAAETAIIPSATEAAPVDPLDRFDLTVPSGADRQSRRSPAIIVAATLFAALVGAYAAVWIGGPRADLFHLAAGPKFLLPPSMREGDQGQVVAALGEGSERSAGESGKSAGPASDSPAPAQGSPATEDVAADSQLADSRGPSAESAGETADGKTVAGLFSDPNVQTVHNEVRERKQPALPWPLSALRDPQFRPLDELQSLREANESAAVEFVEGDLGDRDAVSRKGRAYMQLCELAERFTLADPADHSIPATTQRLVTKELLRQAVAAPANRESLAQIASRWLQYAGRPNQGILLAGQVVDINAVGNDVQYAIELQYRGGSAVANVLQQDITFRTGTTVGVIGIILDDPMSQLVEYKGEAKQILLPIYVFDPDAPRESSEYGGSPTPAFILSP